MYKWIIWYEDESSFSNLDGDDWRRLIDTNLSAAFYAGVSRVIYGAPIERMQAVTDREVALPPEALFADVAGAPELIGGLLAAECNALLEQWQGMASGSGNRSGGGAGR